MARCNREPGIRSGIYLAVSSRALQRVPDVIRLDLPDGDRSFRLRPRSGFPFLLGQALRWRTVPDTIFRCAEETRRRVLGRDASGPGALRRPSPQLAWLDRSCCVPIRAVSAVPRPCIARHGQQVRTARQLHQSRVDLLAVLNLRAND